MTRASWLWSACRRKRRTSATACSESSRSSCTRATTAGAVTSSSSLPSGPPWSTTNTPSPGNSCRTSRRSSTSTTDPRRGFGTPKRGEDLDQVSEIPVAGDRVMHRVLGIDRVPVATPVSFPRHVTGGGQFPDDAMRRALGYPDPFSDLTEPDTRVIGDADQHLCVIGQERPARGPLTSHNTRLSFLDICFMLSSVTEERTPLSPLAQHEEVPVMRDDTSTAARLSHSRGSSPDTVADP